MGMTTIAISAWQYKTSFKKLLHFDFFLESIDLWLQARRIGSMNSEITAPFPFFLSWGFNDANPSSLDQLCDSVGHPSLYRVQQVDVVPVSVWSSKVIFLRSMGFGTCDRSGRFVQLRKSSWHRLDVVFASLSVSLLSPINTRESAHSILFFTVGSQQSDWLLCHADTTEHFSTNTFSSHGL